MISPGAGAGASSVGTAASIAGPPAVTAELAIVTVAPAPSPPGAPAAATAGSAFAGVAGPAGGEVHAASARSAGSEHRRSEWHIIRGLLHRARDAVERVNRRTEGPMSADIGDR
ncbi:MAG: hypothetical protein EXR75_06200 [Myxococcales bacterium]|nr:hypothetical protein [Myxococcales bacterium]